MTNEEFDNEYQNATINYDMVVKSKRCLAITRLTALSLIDCPYMTLGEFFKGISDSDLQNLQDVVEDATNEEENPRVEDLILLTEMLTAAEGVERNNIEDLHSRLNFFSMCVTITSLERKGLVKVNYHNMSFGSDMGDKIVVERLE